MQKHMGTARILTLFILGASALPVQAQESVPAPPLPEEVDAPAAKDDADEPAQQESESAGWNTTTTFGTSQGPIIPDESPLKAPSRSRCKVSQE